MNVRNVGVGRVWDCILCTRVSRQTMSGWIVITDTSVYLVDEEGDDFGTPTKNEIRLFLFLFLFSYESLNRELKTKPKYEFR